MKPIPESESERKARLVRAEALRELIAIIDARAKAEERIPEKGRLVLSIASKNDGDLSIDVHSLGKKAPSGEPLPEPETIDISVDSETGKILRTALPNLRRGKSPRLLCFEGFVGISDPAAIGLRGSLVCAPAPFLGRGQPFGLDDEQALDLREIVSDGGIVVVPRKGASAHERLAKSSAGDAPAPERLTETLRHLFRIGKDFVVERQDPYAIIHSTDLTDDGDDVSRGAILIRTTGEDDRNDEIDSTWE
jgi:hypothetical protein